MGRGYEGAVLKLLRAKDFTLTVTGTTAINDHCLRLHFSAGELFTTVPAHPTMWVRLWFDDNGKSHERGFTLINIDANAGTCDIDFMLHEGRASIWARNAKAGTSIEATIWGTKFHLDTAPSKFLIAGDAASLPAINSILDAYSDTPATVWFEAVQEDDKYLPGLDRSGKHDIKIINGTNGTAGTALADNVIAELPGLVDDNTYVWVATEVAATRKISTLVRKELKIPKDRHHAMGYWRN